MRFGDEKAAPYLHSASVTVEYFNEEDIVVLYIAGDGCEILETTNSITTAILLLMAAYKLYSILTILYNLRAVAGHLQHWGIFTQKSESNGLTFNLVSNLDLSTSKQ